MRFRHFIPAILWFIASVILLTIPGNDLPHEGIFKLPNFDKLVHTGMFFLLTALFSFPFMVGYTRADVHKWFVSVAVLALAYGVLMEFVQKYFAKDRSFDLADISVDALGCLLGFIAISLYYRKKIGPDGNQGRNQN